MVNRDDLSDGGAEIVAETARKIKEVSPGAKVEALVGDFQGNRDALRIILDCPIDVFNHNIEMVERLFPRIRPKANYRQSLAILKLAATETTTPTKSGFMVGLGETDEEIQVLMSDLREAGVTILTIGQYLRPSVRNIKVAKYYTPEEFDNLAERGEKMGFSYVFAGPFVRSSYMAEEVFGAVAHGRRKSLVSGKSAESLSHAGVVSANIFSIFRSPGSVDSSPLADRQSYPSFYQNVQH